VRGKFRAKQEPPSFKLRRSKELDNLNKNSEQEPELSIYDPACAIYSPHVIEAWRDGIDFQPEFNDQFTESFMKLIPIYYLAEDREFSGPKEFWLRNLLSYSFFLGLGVTIFKREYALRLLYGLNEGWSRTVLFWFDEVKNSGQENKNKLWIHAINILTVYARTVWPGTIGLEANEELIKQSAPIAGFTPAIRLGVNDPEFACELFEGALDERKKCDNENLVKKINRIKNFISNSYCQKETSSSN
jgi:hypothetical protein